MRSLPLFFALAFAIVIPAHAARLTAGERLYTCRGTITAGYIRSSHAPVMLEKVAHGKLFVSATANIVMEFDVSGPDHPTEFYGPVAADRLAFPSVRQGYNQLVSAQTAGLRPAMSLPKSSLTPWAYAEFALPEFGSPVAGGADGVFALRRVDLEGTPAEFEAELGLRHHGRGASEEIYGLHCLSAVSQEGDRSGFVAEARRQLQTLAQGEVKPLSFALPGAELSLEESRAILREGFASFSPSEIAMAAGLGTAGVLALDWVRRSPAATELAVNAGRGIMASLLLPRVGSAGVWAMAGRFAGRAALGAVGIISMMDASQAQDAAAGGPLYHFTPRGLRALVNGSDQNFRYFTSANPELASFVVETARAARLMPKKVQ